MPCTLSVRKALTPSFINFKLFDLIFASLSPGLATSRSVFDAGVARFQRKQYEKRIYGKTLLTTK